MALCVNGCVLTLCCPHHDGLIMTELNCVLCACVCVCIVVERGRQNDSDIKAFMCFHVQHVHVACVCVAMLPGVPLCWSAGVYQQDVSSQ